MMGFLRPAQLGQASPDSQRAEAQRQRCLSTSSLRARLCGSAPPPSAAPDSSSGCGENLFFLIYLFIFYYYFFLASRAHEVPATYPPHFPQAPAVRKRKRPSPGHKQNRDIPNTTPYPHRLPQTRIKLTNKPKSH